MKLNYNECRLDEQGMLRYAPTVIKDETGYHANPPREVYAANGWYAKTATPPEPVEGKMWVEDEPKDWAWNDEEMTVAVTFHAEDVPEPEPIPKRYNKYELGLAIEEAGLLDAFLQLFESDARLKFHWNNAEEFEEGDANFEAFKAAMIAAFDEGTVAEILAKAEVR